MVRFPEVCCASTEADGTARFGLARHPALCQNCWRYLRVEFIEAAGDRVERLGDELTDNLLRAY